MSNFFFSKIDTNLPKLTKYQSKADVSLKFYWVTKQYQIQTSVPGSEHMQITVIDINQHTVDDNACSRNSSTTITLSTLN